MSADRDVLCPCLPCLLTLRTDAKTSFLLVPLGLRALAAAAVTAAKQKRTTTSS